MGVANPAPSAKIAPARGRRPKLPLMNALSRQTPATTILLVEDDAPTSRRLQDALGKAGHQVRAAGTLGEARAALAESAPKVLLTDLQLPDGHGVDLIRETRDRFRRPRYAVAELASCV